MRVVDCPFYKREIDYEYCRKCKYYKPYGEDLVYCIAEETIVEIRYARRDSKV